MMNFSPNPTLPITCTITRYDTHLHVIMNSPIPASPQSQGAGTQAAVPVTTLVTEEQLVAVLPPHLKRSVNPALMTEIASVLNDPDMYETYRDNLLGYTSVLKEGKYRMSQYVSAVKYVSHRLMGSTCIDAYIKTFPDRYQDFLMRGVTNKDISSYVTAYNKGQLVNKIYAQTMVAPHILNQDMFQEALNTQYKLMTTAASEKVRTDAAHSLLTHLKPPEVAKLELDLTVKEDSAIAALREASYKLAQAQGDAVRGGASTARELAEAKLVVDVEAKEVQTP